METNDPRNIQMGEYDYPLPDERIARHPLSQRDACRLLCYTPGGTISDHIFGELPSLLPPDAMLVYNDTRVINARLRFAKETGGTIEIFCLEPFRPEDYALSFASTGECSWTCLVGNSKRWKEGSLTMPLTIDGTSFTLKATRMSVPGTASQQILFSWDAPTISFSQIIGTAGEIPIPPYLNRRSESTDTTDYQTVYSDVEGSVAAPTAGLHFTNELLGRLDNVGIERRHVTLHVGAGTFRPVTAETIGGHDMHSEFIAVDSAFIADLADAIEQRRPIVAVGTTSVRTLESLYHIGVAMLKGTWQGELPQWAPYDDTTERVDTPTALHAIVSYLEHEGVDTLYAYTRIIIAPGYTYRVVDKMITNFHQPSSTLLLLVSAMIGADWRRVYDHAIENGYRFLSYGDACLFG